MAILQPSGYEQDVEICTGPVINEHRAAGSDDLRHDSITPVDEVTRTRYIRQAFAPFRYMNKGEMWLEKKLGIETQGIDRIPENKKRPPSILNVFFIWWSMICHIGILPIGFLGPEFGLSLGQSIGAIVAGTLVGALCPAFCGILGPKVSNMAPYPKRVNLLSRLACARLQPPDTPLASTGHTFAPF